MRSKAVLLPGISLAVIICVPYEPLRVIAWFVFILGIVLVQNSVLRRASWAVVATMAWTANFVLTPVAEVMPFPGTPLLWHWGFVIAGILWVTWVVPGSCLPSRGPDWRAAGAAALVTSLLVTPQLFVSMAISGDETYHSAAAYLFWLALRADLVPAGLLLTAIAWLGLGAYLWRRGKFTKGPTLIIWSTSCIVLVALFVPSTLSAARLGNEMFTGRFLRFPAAQPWLSALLAGTSLPVWLQWQAPSLPALRLLPVLSTMGIAYLVTSSWPGKRTTGILIAAAIISCPLLAAYGSILYLEMPLVFLVTVVLRHAREWTLTEPAKIMRHPVWLAVILIGFTKETAAPLLGMLFAARWLCQLLHARGRWQWLPEARLALGAGLPLMVYLSMRMQDQFRPYGAQFENWFDPQLWLQVSAGFITQIQWLIIPAAVGVIGCCKRRRWPMIALLGLTFAGVQGFLLADYRQWVALPRFNLLLLPMLIWAAYQGLRLLHAYSRSACIVAAISLIVANMALSPASFGQRRAPVWQLNEVFLPFDAAMRGIAARKRDARILVANTSTRPGLSLMATLLGDNDFTLRQSPASLTVSEVMAKAKTDKVDFLIWVDAHPATTPPEETQHFASAIVVDRLENDFGTLTVVDLRGDR